MPSVTRKRQGGVRGDARARLIAATERLLASGTPYIELSVEQLCSEAGVARSTFYVHFHDKGELVMRVGERMLEQLTEAADAWWSLGSDREELLAATRRLVDVYAAHRTVLGALEETAVYDPGLRAVQEAMVDRHAEPLARRIEAGKVDGTVRSDLHTRETVVALVGMIQLACERLSGGGEAQLERLAEAITSIAWHALYPDSEDAAA